MSTPDLTEIAIILQDVLARIDNTIVITAPPSPDLGSIDAVAIDLENNRIYGPKTTDPVNPWGPGRPTVGAAGPAGTITEVTVEEIAFGSPPEVVLGGTPSARTILLKLPAPRVAVDGTDGTDGTDGANGWTAIEANVIDGERRVKQVIDWVGGTGAKPATGKFISPSGPVDTAAEATDMRGEAGAGSGDVVGPAVSTNNAVALFDGTTGRLLSDGPGIGDANAGDLLRRSDGDGRYLRTTQLNAVNGVAGLGADGKVPLAQIPASAITDTFVVASQSAMLALTAERGDVAVRSDLSKSFILQAEPASTLANWKELLAPTVVVPVFATKEDVWAGTVADKIVPPSVLAASLEAQSLAVTGGNLAISGNAGINFDVTPITANYTIPNMTNRKQRRTSVVSLSFTGGPWTTSLGSEFKKYASSPPIPTAANSKFDLILTPQGADTLYSVLVKP